MPYQENRVYTKIYGSLPSDSPLLVNVPTTEGHAQQRLHILASQGLIPLSEAVKSDLGIEVVGASGWRPHRWDSLEQYQQVLIQKYGSIAKGRLYLAFDSPHETGLALDFGCGGLMPVSATIATQQTTPLFKWLVLNAYKYGWTPYKVEPWHWEFNIPLENYKSGTVGAQPTQPPENCNNMCTEEGDVCVETIA